jgi:hypothetical protein
VNSSSNTRIALHADDIRPVGAAEISGIKTNDRHTQRISYATAHNGPVIFGTVDELLDVAADIMSCVYSWILVNHLGDWLDDMEKEAKDKETGNAGNAG